MNKPMTQELIQPHQQRIIQEKVDLDIKIGRLGDFINKDPVYLKLPADEMLRLGEQLRVMRRYSDILLERIEAFGLE